MEECHELWLSLWMMQLPGQRYGKKKDRVAPIGFTTQYACICLLMETALAL